MDEEDGRLGPLPGHIVGARSRRQMNVTGSRAQQTGRVDAPQDARATSLCLSPSQSNPNHFRVPQVSILRPETNQLTPPKAVIHCEVML